MSSPLIVPKFRAFTQAGLPLNGGKLESFIAGTSTPLATYPTAADATAGTNPNANPVILDANGEANVWLGVSSYKFILKDSANNVQWTVDAVLESGVSGFQSSAQVTQMSTAIFPVDSVDLTLGLTAQTPTLSCNPLSEFATATGRFTPVAAGTYMVMATVSFAKSGATLRAGNYPQITLWKNGATNLATVIPGEINAGTSSRTTANGQSIVQISVGDYLTVTANVGFSAGAPYVQYSLSFVRLY